MSHTQLLDRDVAGSPPAAPLASWPWTRSLPRAVGEAVVVALAFRLLIVLIPFSPIEMPVALGGWVAALGPTAIGVAVSIALRWWAPRIATPRIRHWMHSTGEALTWVALISRGADEAIPSPERFLISLLVMAFLAAVLGRVFFRFQSDADRARYAARAA